MRSGQLEESSNILLRDELIDGAKAPGRVLAGSIVGAGSDDSGAFIGLEELSLFGESAGLSMGAHSLRPLEGPAANYSGVELVFALGDLCAAECAILSLYMGLSAAGDEAISRLLSQIAGPDRSTHEKINVDPVKNGLTTAGFDPMPLTSFAEGVTDPPGLAGHRNRRGKQMRKGQTIGGQARAGTPRFGDVSVGIAANGLLELGSGRAAVKTNKTRR